MYLVDDLEIFTRVVDAESFTKAGRELRLTTAVISSRISRLEKRLGARLLNRTTRQVQPTEEGRVYYEHARRILEEAERAQQLLAELKSRPAGALRISAPTALGRTHVAPLIPAFCAEHPQVQARLQLTDRVVDLLEEGVDVAVRQGEPPPSSLMIRRLAPDLRVVCAAPSYLARRGAPQSPQELRDHACLLLRFPGSLRYFWTFETESGERFKTRIIGSMDSDSMEALIDWAVAGHGLLMASVWDLADHLREGRLAPTLRSWWPRGLELSALMPPGRGQPAKTRAFVDELVACFASHPDRALTDPQGAPLEA